MRSRLCAATVATAITLLSSSWAVAGQASESTARVDRLASLAEVWAAVKYFHPYLGYREDIDWDAALLAVIPKVRAANTSEEYGTAIDSLLATLGDPVTRVVRGGRSPLQTDLQSSLPPPAHRLTPEGTLIISTGDYSDIPDVAALQATMAAAAEDLSQARSIVFDLRSRTALPANWRGLTSMVLRRSQLAGRWFSTPYLTPSERTRTRNGFQNTYSQRNAPATGTRAGLPIVFLVNSYSDISREMLALQAEGNAVVVAAGEVTDERLVTTTALPLTEGLVAQIRLGELVFADGVRRFRPDVVVTESARTPAADDSALAAAVRLAESGAPRGIGEPAAPAQAVLLSEHTYDDSDYPPLEQRC